MASSTKGTWQFAMSEALELGGGALPVPYPAKPSVCWRLGQGMGEEAERSGHGEALESEG